MHRKTALNVTSLNSLIIETHFSDEEIAQMELQEITYNKHMRN
jgi:hypothetical protein